MSRREFPKSVKVAAFKRANGRCEMCSGLLVAGKFDYDHIHPDGAGGEPNLANCKVACGPCHRDKTSTHDVPLVAKVKRQSAVAAGVKTPTKKIESPGFGESGRRKVHPVAMPARRNILTGERY